MTLEDVAAAIQTALHPGRFFVASDLQLRMEHQPHDTCRWEIFRGHLLDPSQTRLEKSFASWNAFLDPPGRTIISVKYDSVEERAYVLRYIQVYAWEAYEEAGVIDSREAEKWSPELVGTLELRKRAPDLQLEWALERLLFLAVVGTSRLPITSLESPLPLFSLGRLAYVKRWAAMDQVLRDATLILDRLPFESFTCTFDSLREIASLVEFVIRAAPAEAIPKIAKQLASKWRADDSDVPISPEKLFQLIFNGVALSPYTEFITNLRQLLICLAEPEFLGPERMLGIMSYMLRHLVRHLTSYNLMVFHNLGANFPDALALDDLLGAYLQLLEANANAVADTSKTGALLRRALRQAWITRKQLEGLPVPDFPTSPGENLRVLPAPFSRLPEDQIANPAKRSNRLFVGKPAESLLLTNGNALLQQSLRELPRDAELLELGTGVFLDRPLGVLKARGEVDRTPLLSYEAFSRQIARERLERLYNWGLIAARVYEECVTRLETITVVGVPVGDLPDRERPGVVSLEEARRASLDFILTRTTRSSAIEFLYFVQKTMRLVLPEWLQRYHFSLLVRTPRQYLQGSPPPLVIAFDEHMQPQFDFFVAPNDGQAVRYGEWLGVEYLEEGLRVAPHVGPTKQ